MYESPISIIERAVNDLHKQQEEGVFRAIMEYGISVDKEELLKALAYDREQYNKGYDDGVRDLAEKVKNWIFLFGGEYGFRERDIDLLLKEMGVEL